MDEYGKCYKVKYIA